MANSKPPYYYSELVPSMSGDGTLDRTQAESVAYSLEKTAGFENPLLSIEPDISTPENTLDKARLYQKKKKKKKKSEDNPIYRRSQSLFQNGFNVDKFANENQLNKMTTSKSTKSLRRNSEPNIYEEINDNSMEDNVSYYSGSIIGSLFNRRKNSSLNLQQQADDVNSSSSVRDEVAKIHQRHNQILENLNLDVEAMLMPKDEGSNPEDLIRLERSQSDYSNYSEGKNYGSAKSKYASGRAMNEYILQQSDFSSNHENKQIKVSEGVAADEGEPMYMLYDDTMRGKGTPEDNIYEELDIESICWDLSAGELDDNSFFRNHKGEKRNSGKEGDTGLASGFTRWFSTRKKEYELDRRVSRLNKRYTAEEGYVDVKLPKKQRPPLTLQPAPPSLSQEKLQRRYIIGNLADSENSYVITLQRLIRDYKHPLEDSNPPLLCPKKVATMFYRLEQILQCHNIFGIRLSQCIRNWDEEEKIGDVFAATFAMKMVLDIYSEFINNFSLAMETAKQAAKQKSSFAEFLKVKQLTSSDGLSFFGLMVKPVQRFPQFILLLQDLLKHTPPGHHDRISLQLALSRLESLTETLNERKREAEQQHAVRELVKHLGKFSMKGFSEKGHYLLRQDEVLELHLDSNGLLVKSKARRIFLLNDLLVCISVTVRSSSSHGEHYNLKWAVPLQEVEVQEEVAPATSNLMASSRNSVRLKGDSTTSQGTMKTLYDDLKDLVHDLEVIARISALVSTLKKDYPGLNVDNLQKISEEIHENIKEKDEEITLLDSCCLYVALPAKSRSSKEVVYLQFRSPEVKRDWSTDVRLARLALDINNNPSWDSSDPTIIIKQPLFVKALSVYSNTCASEVKCGCYYEVGGGLNGHFLWLSSSDGVNSHLVILELHHNFLKEVANFDLAELRVLAMEPVGPLVWIGTDSRKLLLLDGMAPEKWGEISSTTLPSAVLQIKHHGDQVLVALATGILAIYHHDDVGQWKLSEPLFVTLDAQFPVTCIISVANSAVYCGCGPQVWLVDPKSGQVIRSHLAEGGEEVGSLAHSGTGLFVTMKHSSTVYLYHYETFQLLQDIDVAKNVQQLLTTPGQDIAVTTLCATRGLLWVGTNVGVILTVPLPRLEGVPIVGQRTNIALHRHNGPVSLLLNLQSPTTFVNQPPMPPPAAKASVYKQKSDSMLPQPKRSISRTSSQLRYNDCHESGAKTLPRSMALCQATVAPGGSSSCSGGGPMDVYGLYADLMNLQDYESQDRLYERLNQSDPELVRINAAETHQKRLVGGRPRSWDLSAMAVSEDSDSSIANESTGTSSTEADVLKKDNQDFVITPTNARTILMVTGGCGYISYRNGPTAGNNATVMIWETKC